MKHNTRSKAFLLDLFKLTIPKLRDPIMTAIFRRLLLCSIFLTPLTSFATQVSYEVKQIGNNLWSLRGINGFTGGNIVLSVGNDGVVLVDDGLKTTTELLNSTIRDITSDPVDFLINTHIHADHIGNNEHFSMQGAHIVAHNNMRKRLIELSMPQAKGVKVSTDKLPVITFEQSMNIHLNGDDISIVHLPNAHTDGDALIHFKKSNVLHTGDTFFNHMFPFIDFNRQGTLNGLISAQEEVNRLTNAQTTIIPGHGNIASKKDLLNSIKMLKDVREIISNLILEGKTEDEIVKLEPLRKYSSWSWRFINTEKMTRQVYQAIHNESTTVH